MIVDAVDWKFAEQYFGLHLTLVRFDLMQRSNHVKDRYSDSRCDASFVPFHHQIPNTRNPGSSRQLTSTSRFKFIMSEGKISVYSVPDLKNTTDDALPNYLTSLKFKPNYQTQDIKLVLGYTAVAISAALFYADWKLGWDQTKAYTLPAVVVYFLLNGLFTYWIFYVEKGAIFVGEKGGSKVHTYFPPSFISTLEASYILCKQTLYFISSFSTLQPHS
jgi:hypothetical protein